MGIGGEFARSIGISDQVNHAQSIHCGRTRIVMFHKLCPIM